MDGSTPHSLARQRLRAVLLCGGVILAGLALTLATVTGVHRLQKQAHRAGYLAGIDRWTAGVEECFQHAQGVVASTARLVSQQRSGAETAARTMLAPILSAEPEFARIAWHPRAADSGNDSPQRPWITLGGAPAEDIATEAARQALARASAGGGPAVSAPYTTNALGEMAVALVTPAARGSTAGVMTLTLLPGRLFATLRDPALRTVEVYDVTDAQQPIPVRLDQSGQKAAPGVERRLHIGDRVWQANFLPVPGPQLGAGVSGMLLLGGLALSILGGVACGAAHWRRSKLRERLRETHAGVEAMQRRLERAGSEREQLLRALAESEAKYRLVAEMPGDIVSCHTRRGEVTFTSPAVHDILGYAPDALAGTSLDALVHEGDREAVREQRRQQLAASASARTVCRVRHRHGHHIWMETSHHRIAHSDAWYWLCVSRDVSDRIAAERQVRDSEEMLRLFFDNSRVGMAFISTAEARFIRVNPALATLLGYATAELEGLTVADVTHPADREVSPSEFQRVLAGMQQDFRVDKRYLHRNGDTIWITAHTALVRARDGAAQFFITHIQRASGPVHGDRATEG